jgi:hypothetical protein
MNKPMTDKTQEELDFLLLRFGNSCISQIPRDINYTKGLILAYINKYYVPKGDLEDPSVSNEDKLNQADKLSEVTNGK